MEKINMGKITQSTQDAMERFIEEQEAAMAISPEMEALREKSLDLLKAKSKKTSYTELLEGLEAMQDDDSEMVRQLLQTTEEKVKEADEVLKTSTQEMVNSGNREDFVKVAKRTRFATSMKEISAPTFASDRDEIQTRLGETINEQILLTNPEMFAEMLDGEQNDNIKRFVGMYRQRAVSQGIGGWLETNILNEEQKRRAIEQLEEMKGNRHFKKTIESLITRWLGLTETLKDKTKTEEEQREFIETSRVFLMNEFIKEFTLIGI